MPIPAAGPGPVGATRSGCAETSGRPHGAFIHLRGPVGPVGSPRCEALGQAAARQTMALAALRVAGRRGLAVPHDLAIISFDDTPIVRFSNPPLTAVVQPIAAMASAAADLLIRAKSGQEDLPQASTPPFQLAVRASTVATSD